MGRPLTQLMEQEEEKDSTYSDFFGIL